MLEFKYEDFLIDFRTTTNEVSKKSGISLRQVYNIKNKKQISFNMLVKLQKAYNNSLKKYIQHDTVKIKWGCKAIEGI